ncbi:MULTISPECIES: hypothetical protein [Pseudomonas]|uniref:Uncharacterized protein n=1 Tax=Pseudomonas luteola TaxID=47886 RepID=A0ABS0MXF6_PSELU|nr:MULTISPECIES: hypothetical protein [Pseudomonas]MBH3441384.1 hypothetical protein [Pseudomonas luteola]RRW40098.1 hypothetical protein EGJ50_25065 [Pseudomonas luteola]
MSYRNDAAMREQLAQIILANCRIAFRLKEEGRPSASSAVQDVRDRAVLGQSSTDLSGGDRHEKV